MKESRMKDALEAITRRDVPDNIDLWPRLSARLSRKSLMQTVRAKPLLVVLIVILTLLLLTTAAYAVGNMIGYIPGIGFVNRAAPIRVLAEPVSMTRAGITITVKQALLSSDKTVILFSMENIPFDKLSPRGDMQCPQASELRLPDGTLLQSGEGGSNGTKTGYEWRLTYAPVPANVNNAVLFVPCILDAAPGVLPENWELPLSFISAPPNMTVMPVIEITPSPAPTSGSGTAIQNPLSITKVIDAGDSYILIGEFNPPVPSEAVDDWSSAGSIKLNDANGQEIPYDFPQDLDLPPAESPKTDVWSIKFSKGFAPPLRITYSNLYTLHVPSQETVEFEFDAGPNPQEGQTWKLNKEIRLAGHTFTLVSITAQQGYSFNFTSSDNKISNVGIDIPGYTSNGGGMDTCGCIQPPPNIWGEGVGYAKLPKGKLKIVLSDLWIYGETKDWTIDWQPENSSSNVLPPTPMGGSQACLTLDSWQAAISSPAPIPPDLTGKLIASGRILEDGKDPSPDNSGVFTIDLDGSNKRVIGPGRFPSLSPDGAQAAYAKDDGLYLANLTSGENHHIPNTTAQDDSPHWSPDGNQIAFMRSDDRTDAFHQHISNLYIINPDGTELHRVTNERIREQLIGWSPDGTGLYYDVTDGSLHENHENVDIASGVTGDLFVSAPRESFNPSFNVSADWKVAFFDRVDDHPNDGLYVSKLDGSDRKLIARQVVINPIWSPDGKWLIMNTYASRWALALVNVEDCRIIPLSWNGDEVFTWIP